MNISDKIRGIVSEREEEFTDLVNQGKALPDTFHHRVIRFGKRQVEVTVEWQILNVSRGLTTVLLHRQYEQCSPSHTAPRNARQ